jgi:hypothetical protein
MNEEFRDSVRQLHRRKDAAYKDAWKKRGEVLSILANVARKVDRLEYALDGAPATQDESLLDTAVDLLIYALKYQTYLADQDHRVAITLFAQSNIIPPYSDGTEAFEVLLDNIKFTDVEGVNQIPASAAASNLNTAFSEVAKYIESGATVPIATRAERAAVLTHAAVLLVDSLIREAAGHTLTSPMSTWNAHMQVEDYAKLLEDVEYQLCGAARSVGVLGLTPVTTQLLRSLAPSGLLQAVQAVYVPDQDPVSTSPIVVPVRGFEDLAQVQHDVLVVAADAEKEDLLLAALPHIKGTPKVIVAGYGHLTFRDKLFNEERDKLLVPSLANGYPNTLTHLYQCLTNAARLGINGVVVEFGMFKGGTTMFLSRIIEKLGMDWSVIGFDTP